MYHVSVQGVDERMINVHYYYYYVQMSLDPHHVTAFENMRRAMKTPSRVRISLFLPSLQRCVYYVIPASPRVRISLFLLSLQRCVYYVIPASSCG